MNIYKWRRAFGVGYAPGDAVWDLVLSGMAHDLSSKRHFAPSFGVEDSGVSLRIWVDALDPSRRLRPGAPRYRLQILDHNASRVVRDETHESPEKAEQAYRRLLNPYARIVANYRHKTTQ